MIKKKQILLFCLVGFFFYSEAQSLTRISPDTVIQGQHVKIGIYGSNTNFKYISNPSVVYFVQNYDYKIFADSLDIKNDSLIYGYFQIPYTFTGNYDLTINSTPFISLPKALFIQTQSIVPKISYIDPDSAYQGSFFTFRIYGENTHFLNCSYFKVWLLYSYADAITVINDTVVEVAKQIPFSITPGKYNIKIENSRDGVIIKSMILSVLKSPFAPELKAIKPDSAEQGETVKALITARNTFFTTSQVQYISIWQNNYGIYCDSFRIINDTSINAWFTPVYSSYAGIYDLKVKHTPDEVLLLKSCFKVSQTLDPPKIVSVSPDSAYQNDDITLHIRGHNTHFTFLNRQPGLNLKLNSYYISSFSSVTVVNDTYFYAVTKIPLEAPEGIYNITVYDSMDGQMFFTNAFKVKKMPNAPQVILGLPDTMIYGEDYMMRIFCKNTNYSLGVSPYFRLQIGEHPGDHFDQDEIFIINDTTIFSTIKASKYWSAPYGSYDITLGNSTIGFIEQNYAVTLIPGKYEPQMKQIIPNKFLQGDTYSINIIGKNTKFTQAPYQIVRLYYSWNSLINASSYTVVNDTLINASFVFPTGYLGRWKIGVRDSGDVELTFPIEIVQPAYGSQFTSIVPAIYKIGDTQSFTVHAKNTFFAQYPGEQQIFLIRSYARDTIATTNCQILNDTTVTFDLITSKTVYPGEFDIFLSSGLTFHQGLKFSRFSNTAKILSVSPDTSVSGQELTLQLDCKGTKFTKDEIIFPVFTSPAGKFLYADSFSIINDSAITMLLNIPKDAETGIWDITLLTDQEGDFHLKSKFKIRSDVSIDETKNSDLVIFPNPFCDYIKIHAETLLLQVALYDLTGRVIFSNDLVKNNQCYINTNNLDQGVYILKIVNEKQVVLEKIVKK